MIRKIVEESEGRPYILVDFFDTIMFRCVHSHQLMAQWENAMKKKYPFLEGIDLCRIRRNVITELGNNECAINYYDLTSAIYRIIRNSFSDICSEKEFQEVSYMVDYSVDMATQYPNRKLIETLYFLKKEQQKKIYLVSDYYLPGKCYESYLRPYMLENFFDGIFCSSDYKSTKRSCELYRIILSSIGCNANQAFMIGDSKRSDCQSAHNAGIKSYRYFPFFHKVHTNIRKRIGYSFCQESAGHIFENSFKNTIFGEYALILYYFTSHLYSEIEIHDNEPVGFLSRGGYFLKKCFDVYQKVCGGTVQTYYIKNSRKVNRLAAENKEDKRLLNLYLKQFAKSNRLCLVDEGWYCSSQILMQRNLGYDTQGYYIGIMGRNQGDEKIKRKGILFDIDERGNKSPLFGIFRTNCVFYEQLLSAPHGSTVKYYEEDGIVNAKEVWNETEKQNYYKNVERMQKIILDYITGLAVWQSEISLYRLSNYVLKSQLFGSGRRLEVLSEMNNSWYDNANDTAEKKFADIKNLEVSIGGLLVRPENYLRYLCKLKDLKLTHFSMKIIYPILGPCIYLYCRISIFLKYRNE